MTADESGPTETAVFGHVSTAVGHNFVFAVMRWQTAAQCQSAKPNVAETLQIDCLRALRAWTQLARSYWNIVVYYQELVLERTLCECDVIAANGCTDTPQRTQSQT
jgi:hypothetical protein